MYNAGSSFDEEVISESREGFCVSNLAEEQAGIFLLDAQEYRSIEHRIDEFGLRIYRYLFSKYWQVTVLTSIVALHLLAFFEYPSSLSISSLVNRTHEVQGRIHVPSSPLLVLEGVFVVVILADGLFQAYLHGFKISLKTPWVTTFTVLMIIYWIDYIVSMFLTPPIYEVRIRRFIRPFFAIQKSQLMKKVLKSLSKTMKDILSAFILLAVWLITFTIIGVSIFSGFDKYIDQNYETFYDAFFTLLVLLTTANNPDAMIKVFNKNRLSFLFFVIFMSVGIFVFMNVLIAIIFNEFRGHVLESMQTSLFRRRIASRAMFEVLKRSSFKALTPFCDDVSAESLRKTIELSSLCQWRKEEMIKYLNTCGAETFDWEGLKKVLLPLDDHKDSKIIVSIPKYTKDALKKLQRFFLSKVFNIIGLLICVANVIVIGVDVSTKNEKASIQAKSLEALNWIFIILYVIEQLGKFFAMGLRTYFSKRGCLFDFIITAMILMMKIFETVVLVSYEKSRRDVIIGMISVWDLPRITNLMILLRAARVVQFIPAISPIIKTLFDIPWRMKSVIGILVALFYFYALLGMCLFGKSITPEFMANYTDCGTYQQLDYGGINFSDFYSSIVVLWCLLIVNNWHVFMIAFQEATNGNKWVHLYMISWWILAVIIVLNCVTAFVIEAYTQRKSYYIEEHRLKQHRRISLSEVLEDSVHYLRSSIIVDNSFTFQMLFSNDLVEPTEIELLIALKDCHFLCSQYPHLLHSKYSTG